MKMRAGRVLRGMAGVVLMLAGWISAPAMAQWRQEGAIPDGKGGLFALAAGDPQGTGCGIRNDGEVTCWGGPLAQDFPPPRGPFMAVSVADSAACGLRDNGEIACWGDPNSPLMRESPPPYQFTAISVGDARACALSAPGSHVQCWGDVQGIMPPEGRFVAISVGGYITCGLRANGHAECWGSTASNTPAGVFTAIAAGKGHACGLRPNGHVECWGDPPDGAGEPPADQTFTAISVAGPRSCGLRSDGKVQCWSGWAPLLTNEDYVALSAGRENLCAIARDHSVHCWDAYGNTTQSPPGDVRFGFGAIDTAEWRTCEIRPGDGQLFCLGSSALPGNYNEVAVGEQFGCARNSQGRVECWGDNQYHQTEVPFDPLRGLSLGRAHACALKTNGGDAACWGWNSNGQTDVPAAVFRNISAGMVHSCGALADGTGACWGYNGDGQSIVPMLDGDLQWLAIQAGSRNSCGLSSDNFIRCWGQDFLDQPYPPTGYFRALSVGNNHGCAIRTDGRLACWGANWAGQAMAPEGTFAAVTAGETYTCAIRSNGTRECWGDYPGLPKLRLNPDRLPPVRPDQWFNVSLQLVQESYPYQAIPGHYTVVEGSLPQNVWLDTYGTLVGAVHEPGRYTFTIEGRDDNGFAARRQYVLSVDATPPVITPVISGVAGDNGWYTSGVNLAWSVTDPESDILWSTGCDPVTLGSDTPDAGFMCHAESGGGVADAETHVKIDQEPPHTRMTSAPRYDGAQATFEFAGDDNLSGLAGFECSVDGAPFATCASPYTATVATGPHEFQVRAVDTAGNRDPWPFRQSWVADATPPVIDVHVDGIEGRNGWYLGNVQIMLGAYDPDSPVTTQTGCGASTLATDAIGASFTCTATSDGGTTTRTVTVKRDATPPVITATPTTAPNAAGWYRTGVTVVFACADATSGIEHCDDNPQWLDGEGAVSSYGHAAMDVAGNPAISNVVTVNIDHTAPTLAPAVSASVLLLNGTAAVAANGSDALSGIAAQTCDPLDTGSVGVKQVECRVSDRAGNVAAGSASYRVAYGFNGFNAPVQNPSVLNVIKAGRSIPLRWRVVDANGAPVTNLSTAAVTATAISCPSATENRITTYGGGNGQLQNLGNGYYGFDWAAASSLRGQCRRLELDLGDGQVHPALFKFN